jgi:late competence protein required for DNA uptake (superfamily II DNA/RNA helicase)
MTIQEYIHSKLIDCKDLHNNFELIETINVKKDKKGCYKCENYVQFLPSRPWTGCYQCNSCKTITGVYYHDMMAGGDTIYTLAIFKDKV